MPKPRSQHAAPPALQPDTAPDTFKVTGWKVFAPGYHKGKLYTAAENRQTVANFQRLSKGDNPWLKAKAKFGHDSQQRIAKSLGLMAAGRITDCRETPDCGFEIDIDSIPHYLLTTDQDGKAVQFDLKKAFDDGNINDGSVELLFEVPEPDDPSQLIPGPVLEGVAFLGEEQPAVPGNPAPVATFSRDHTVPSSAAVTFREFHGRRVAVRRVVFSEVTPMNRDEILAKLTAAGLDASKFANMDDAGLATVLDQVSGDEFATKMKAKYAAEVVPPVPAPKTPETPVVPKAPEGDALAKFASTLDEISTTMSKRFGAIEATVNDLQKMKPDLQAAAKFSRTFEEQMADVKKTKVTEAVTKAIDDLLLAPVDMEDFIAIGMTKSDAVTFSADKKPQPTELAGWIASLQARPKSHFAREIISDTEGDDEITPTDRRTLEKTQSGRERLRRHDERKVAAK